MTKTKPTSNYIVGRYVGTKNIIISRFKSYKPTNQLTNIITIYMIVEKIYNMSI